MRAVRGDRLLRTALLALLALPALLALSCSRQESSSVSLPLAAPASAPLAPAHTTAPLETLAREVRSAFQAQPGFTSLGKPREGEWLDRHAEPGQTVAEFERAERVVPTTDRRTLFILPIGPFEPGQGPPMGLLVDYLQRFTGLPVQVLPGLVDARVLGARSRKRWDREQLLTGDLLDALRQRVPASGYGLVGVTMSDLFPDPRWNYAFGEARFAERVGVYSFARYDPAFHGDARGPDSAQLILARSLKVMAHEVGHMFGMEHCTAYHCVMNGTNSLEETDRATMHLCPVCLRKLHLAVGFAPAERYAALEAFYAANGFADEAKWVAARREYLRGR